MRPLETLRAACKNVVLIACSTRARVLALSTLASVALCASAASPHGDAPILAATTGGGHGHGHGARESVGHGGEMQGHDHGETMSLAGGEAPVLALSLAGSESARLVVGLDVERLHFSREHADGPHVAGEGHAHLYLDGVKLGRIYETTHVLPPMEPGLHTIRIGLFTNDHRAYAADGVPVERTIVFQAPAADVALPPGPAARAEVRIENGEAAPRSARVTQGELVGIEWSSDAAHDLHLHGYDIEMHVEPGVAAAVYLVVHASGRFPVAMHGGAGGHGHSTLFSLEVYPR